MTDALSLAAGAARVELSPDSRRRHRGIHVRRHRRAAPDAADGARGGRCPRPCVLSARPLFEPHRACAARVRGPRHRARTQFRRPSAFDPWRRVAATLARRRARRGDARSSRSSTRRRAPRRARGHGLSAPRSGSACRPTMRGATLTAKLSIANTGDSGISVRPRLSSVLPANGDDRARFRRRLRLGKRRDADADPPSRRSLPSGAAESCRRDASRGIDNVFTDWNGVATLTDPARPFDTASPPTAPPDSSWCMRLHARDFVAVEPVTHMTDAFNRAERGESGTGTPDSCGRRGIFLYDANLRPPALMTASARSRRRFAACSTSRRASANARYGRRPSRCCTGSTSTRRRSTATIRRPGHNTVMPMPESIGCFALRRAAGSSSRCAAASGSPTRTER